MPRPPNEEELAQGTYWTPPCEVTITDAHPRLLAALRAGAAIEQMHLFVAGAYDMGSGAPMGQLEVAIDCNRGLACGAFRSIINGEDIRVNPRGLLVPAIPTPRSNWFWTPPGPRGSFSDAA